MSHAPPPLLLLVILLAGCGSGSDLPPRGKLWGKVTLDGQPVASGIVRFIALDPSAVNAVAKITNGEYSVPEEAGLAKGKYRVEFSVPSPTEKTKTENPDIPGQWLEEPKELLPPRYHRDSNLTIDYDPANPQPYDVELSTR